MKSFKLIFFLRFRQVSVWTFFSLDGAGFLHEDQPKRRNPFIYLLIIYFLFIFAK